MSGASPDVRYPEILVIGGGPAAIASALRARQSGASVTLIDDNPGLGGQIWRAAGNKRRSESQTWLERFRRSGATALCGAQAIAADAASNTVLVETLNDAFEVHYRKLIIATGARELFLPFPGWTLPGVFGAGGLQALAKSGLRVAGKRIVAGGSGPLLLAVASYLRTEGANVLLIAEQASSAALARFAGRLIAAPEKIVEAARLRVSLGRVPYLSGCWIEAAEGNGHLERVRFRRGCKIWTEECDYAAVGYGLYQNSEFPALMGCKLEGHAVAVDELQRTSQPDVFCAGECTGIGGLDLSLVEGEIAGYAATGDERQARALFGRRAKAQQFADALNQAFRLRGELTTLAAPETIVCRCEDVSFGRLKGFGSFRAAKLQTRCGMGPCQARVCGPAAEFLFGWTAESVRPPVYPVRLATLAINESTEEQSTAQ